MTISSRREGTMRSRKSLVSRIAAKIGICLLVFAMAPAWSQAPVPPIRPTIDANGVDLFRGTLQFSSTEVAIGRPGAGGLSFDRTYLNIGWRHGYVGSIESVGNVYTVTIGDHSE